MGRQAGLSRLAAEALERLPVWLPAAGGRLP
ncbi:hypothetical protein SAMN06264364_13660 [Quadrisphaera granulorum]|uniref:Uncharacterized protein n=1 Tax=Quadrisphaera granulorum TaxID=317664 RepID=A0A315ZRX3_9ACTN|nr:hypothetical protein BXY45_13660 [Quadrisphaera granulorum]SZE98758.1 hypothetical protein SAMN06264364_13660 [Quadrisphaera granulorum]